MHVLKMVDHEVRRAVALQRFLGQRPAAIGHPASGERWAQHVYSSAIRTDFSDADWAHTPRAGGSPRLGNSAAGF